MTTSADDDFWAESDDGGVIVHLTPSDLDHVRRIVHNRIHGGAPMSEALRARVRGCPTCDDILRRNGNLSFHFVTYLLRVGVVPEDWPGLPLDLWWAHMEPIEARTWQLGCPSHPDTDVPLSAEVEEEIAARQEACWERAWNEAHGIEP